MKHHILSINPGSTSTKIALYVDKTEKFTTSIPHSDQALEGFDELVDQYDFRHRLVLEELSHRGYPLERLHAVVGRGGLFPNIQGGGYGVNQAMVEAVYSGEMIAHASNLGCLIARSIAQPLSIPAYVYDCVSADELMDEARVTGIPQVVRTSLCHVLNSKATARRTAEMAGKRYEEMNFIVAHLGGGISISAHRRGQIVDAISDDEGPFSPDRAGAISSTAMMKLCFSGQYTQREMKKTLRGGGGLRALLGTGDCQEIGRRIQQGDSQAALVFQAMAYQIARGIYSLVPALDGQVNRVVITGGIAHSSVLMPMLMERLGTGLRVAVVAGEAEMESLALGALRMLRGEEPVKQYLGIRPFAPRKVGQQTT